MLAGPAAGRGARDAVTPGGGAGCADSSASVGTVAGGTPPPAGQEVRTTGRCPQQRRRHRACVPVLPRRWPRSSRRWSDSCRWSARSWGTRSPARHTVAPAVADGVAEPDPDRCRAGRTVEYGGATGARGARSTSTARRSCAITPSGGTCRPAIRRCRDFRSCRSRRDGDDGRGGRPDRAGQLVDRHARSASAPVARGRSRAGAARVVGRTDQTDGRLRCGSWSPAPSGSGRWPKGSMVLADAVPAASPTVSSDCRERAAVQVAAGSALPGGHVSRPALSRRAVDRSRSATTAPRRRSTVIPRARLLARPSVERPRPPISCCSISRARWSVSGRTSTSTAVSSCCRFAWVRCTSTVRRCRRSRTAHLPGAHRPRGRSSGPVRPGRHRCQTADCGRGSRTGKTTDSTCPAVTFPALLQPAVGSACRSRGRSRVAMTERAGSSAFASVSTRSRRGGCTPTAACGRACWRRSSLGRRERAIWHALKAPERRRLEWLLGRIAAKDAVRAVSSQRRFHLTLHPADVEILPDRVGPPGRHRRMDGAGRPRVPLVSISHVDGVGGGGAHRWRRHLRRRHRPRATRPDEARDGET